MSGWARPGVKCVCVRDGRWISAERMEAVDFGPVRGEVVTIVQVVEDNFGVGLHLAEYRIDLDGDLALFPLRDFRPVVSEEEDLALFAHHLDKVGEPA